MGDLDVSEVGGELLGHVCAELGGGGLLLLVADHLVPGHHYSRGSLPLGPHLSLMSSILRPIQGRRPPLRK